MLHGTLLGSVAVPSMWTNKKDSLRTVFLFVRPQNSPGDYSLGIEKVVDTFLKESIIQPKPFL